MFTFFSSKPTPKTEEPIVLPVTPPVTPTKLEPPAATPTTSALYFSDDEDFYDTFEKPSPKKKDPSSSNKLTTPVVAPIPRSEIGATFTDFLARPGSEKLQMSNILTQRFAVTFDNLLSSFASFKPVTLTNALLMLTQPNRKLAGAIQLAEYFGFNYCVGIDPIIYSRFADCYGLIMTALGDKVAHQANIEDLKTFVGLDPAAPFPIWVIGTLGLVLALASIATGTAVQYFTGNSNGILPAFKNAINDMKGTAIVIGSIVALVKLAAGYLDIPDDSDQQMEKLIAESETHAAVLKIAVEKYSQYPADIVKDRIELAEMTLTADRLTAEYNAFFKSKTLTIVSGKVAKMSAQHDKLKTLLLEFATRQSTKQEPVVIYLYGKPGQGKTSILENLSRRLSTLCGRNLSSYTRPPADQYWSSYAQQDIVILDDFGTNTNGSGGQDLMAMYGNSAYRLNMAAVDEKGLCFTSPWVFISSNHLCPAFADIACTDAITRRRDITLQVSTPAFDEWKLGNPEKGDTEWPGWPELERHIQLRVVQPGIDTAEYRPVLDSLGQQVHHTVDSLAQFAFATEKRKAQAYAHILERKRTCVDELMAPVDPVPPVTIGTRESDLAKANMEYMMNSSMPTKIVQQQQHQYEYSLRLMDRQKRHEEIEFQRNVAIDTYLASTKPSTLEQHKSRHPLLFHVQAQPLDVDEVKRAVRVYHQIEAPVATRALRERTLLLLEDMHRQKFNFNIFGKNWAPDPVKTWAPDPVVHQAGPDHVSISHFLFLGEPGTGKSTMAKHLAGDNVIDEAFLPANWAETNRVILKATPLGVPFILTSNHRDYYARKEDDFEAWTRVTRRSKCFVFSMKDPDVPDLTHIDNEGAGSFDQHVDLLDQESLVSVTQPGIVKRWQSIVPDHLRRKFHSVPLYAPLTTSAPLHVKIPYKMDEMEGQNVMSILVHSKILKGGFAQIYAIHPLVASLIASCAEACAGCSVSDYVIEANNAFSSITIDPVRVDFLDASLYASTNKNGHLEVRILCAMTVKEDHGVRYIETITSNGPELSKLDPVVEEILKNSPHLVTPEPSTAGQLISTIAASLLKACCLGAGVVVAVNNMSEIFTNLKGAATTPAVEEVKPPEPEVKTPDPEVKHEYADWEKELMRMCKHNKHADMYDDYEDRYGKYDDYADSYADQFHASYDLQHESDGCRRAHNQNRTTRIGPPKKISHLPSTDKFPGAPKVLPSGQATVAPPESAYLEAENIIKSNPPATTYVPLANTKNENIGRTTKPPLPVPWSLVPCNRGKLCARQHCNFKHPAGYTPTDPWCQPATPPVDMKAAFEKAVAVNTSNWRDLPQTLSTNVEETLTELMTTWAEPPPEDTPSEPPTQHEACVDPAFRAIGDLVTKNVIKVKGGSALVITQRLAVTPWHMAATGWVDACARGTWSKCRVVRFSRRKDQAFFMLPKTVVPYPDLTKHIRSIKDHHRSSYMATMWICREKDGPDTKTIAGQTVRNKIHSRDIIPMYAQGLVNESIMTGEIENKYSYMQYYTLQRTSMDNSLTVPGDCGSPLIAVDPKMPKKLMGLHAAGNSIKAFATDLVKEDFQDLLTTNESATVHQSLPTVDFPIKEGDFIFNKRSFKAVANLDIIDENDGSFFNSFQRVAIIQKNGVNKGQRIPTSTHYRRSPFAFGETGYAPAIMGQGDRGCEECPLDKSFGELNKHKPVQDVAELIDLAKETGRYLADTTVRYPTVLRVITNEEALNGMSEYACSAPVYRNTAAGLPWSRANGIKGKYPMLKVSDTGHCTIDVEHPLGKQLIHDIEHIERHLADDDLPLPAFIYSTALKDEPRPIAKIREHKTRMFAPSELAMIIVHRKLLHALGCSVTQTRLEHPLKMGLNPTSSEWDYCLKQSLAISAKGFDADVRGFDKMFPPEMFLAIAEMEIEYWKSIGELDIKTETMIRRLYKCKSTPFYVLGHRIYAVRGSQATGQPATSGDNSKCSFLYQLLMFRKFIDPHAAVHEMVKKVSWWFMGDDMKAYVHPTIREKYNFNTVKAGMKERFNIDVTNGAKTCVEHPLVDFSELVFLNRKHRYISEMNMTVGALVDPPFDKMLNWCRVQRAIHVTKVDFNLIEWDDETIGQTVETALLEGALRGQKYFDGLVDHFRVCAKKYRLPQPQFQSYYHTLFRAVHLNLAEITDDPFRDPTYPDKELEDIVRHQQSLSDDMSWRNWREDFEKPGLPLEVTLDWCPTQGTVVSNICDMCGSIVPGSDAMCLACKHPEWVPPKGYKHRYMACHSCKHYDQSFAVTAWLNEQVRKQTIDPHEFWRVDRTEWTPGILGFSDVAWNHVPGDLTRVCRDCRRPAFALMGSRASPTRLCVQCTAKAQGWKADPPEWYYRYIEVSRDLSPRNTKMDN